MGTHLFFSQARPALQSVWELQRSAFERSSFMQLVTKQAVSTSSPSPNSGSQV
jgi:hypothetical protein